MKVSGFSFIRNGIQFDYPFLEAIRSILPVCDEFIVVVGDSSDGTRDAVVKLSDPKIKIIDTVWDESLREGGKILAQQTNIAMDHITGDWGFYIQGDEVVHEKYLGIIRDSMERYQNHTEVDGLLFHYRHFYGSYDYVGSSRRWYRKEIRIIRNDKSIRSYKDAQGFRKNGNKLRVKQIPASVYHYGWVKDPRSQQEKQKYFHKLWHDDSWVEQKVAKTQTFDYEANIDVLEKFTETHPEVMHKRIALSNWNFSYTPKKLKLKERVSGFMEKLTGYRIGEYKNYKII